MYSAFFHGILELNLRGEKMIQRYLRVLCLNKNQSTIEWKGKTVTISRKEKRLGRIALSLTEFIPLFCMFVILSDFNYFSQFDVASVQGFLLVTGIMILIFFLAFILGFLIYWIGIRKALK